MNNIIPVVPCHRDLSALQVILPRLSHLFLPLIGLGEKSISRVSEQKPEKFCKRIWIIACRSGC